MNMKKIGELTNGVEVFRHGKENDFIEANGLLEMHEDTEQVDAYDVWEERYSYDKWAYTFGVEVTSNKSDYERFVRMLNRNIQEDYATHPKRQEILDSYDSYFEGIEQVCKWRDSDKEKRPMHFERDGEAITFDIWKEGRLPNGQKLGKYLRKWGFSQELIDFYSSQSRFDTRKVYFTVTDCVQDIAGMSYYGKGWSSCQSPTSSYGYYKKVLGSMKDRYLYIGWLHDDIDDAYDMEGCGLARSVMREWFDSGDAFLVNTEIYGDMKETEMMEQVLSSLSEIGILYSGDVYGDDSYRVDGLDCTEIEVTDYIHFVSDRDIHCPHCDGAGYLDESDGYSMEFTCPRCQGDGMINDYYEEELEVTGYINHIAPYCEGYEHYGHRANMYLDKVKVSEKLSIYRELMETWDKLKVQS